MLGHVGNICAKRLWIATLLGSPLHHWVAGEVERLESPNGDSHHPGRAASGMLHALTRAWHPHWELFWNDFEALTTMTQLLDAAFDSSTILQLSGGHQWTRVFWFASSTNKSQTRQVLIRDPQMDALNMSACIRSTSWDGFNASVLNGLQPACDSEVKMCISLQRSALLYVCSNSDLFLWSGVSLWIYNVKWVREFKHKWQCAYCASNVRIKCASLNTPTHPRPHPTPISSEHVAASARPPFHRSTAPQALCK